jgi:hypothetical protein
VIIPVKNIQATLVNHKPAKRCSDYDDECVSVTSPSRCFVGNEHMDIADGFFPMLFSN